MDVTEQWDRTTRDEGAQEESVILREVHGPYRPSKTTCKWMETEQLRAFKRNIRLLDMD